MEVDSKDTDVSSTGFVNRLLMPETDKRIHSVTDGRQTVDVEG